MAVLSEAERADNPLTALRIERAWKVDLTFPFPPGELANRLFESLRDKTNWVILSALRTGSPKYAKLVTAELWEN